jgi:hypothetical protein
MAFVSGDHGRRTSERNRRNEQIRATNLLEFLVLAEPIEFSCGGLINRKDHDLTEQFLAANQPVRARGAIVRRPLPSGQN